MSVATSKTIIVSKATFDRLIEQQAQWQLDSHQQHSLNDVIERLLTRAVN